MEKQIKDSSVIKATGRSIVDWIKIIQSNGKGDLSHKEIATFLSDQHNLSPWWAQEVTVLYEKKVGRRITGQTKDSGFQVGVNKKLPISKDKLWRGIASLKGFAIISGEEINPEEITGQTRLSASGIKYKLTVYEPYSHMRMQWRLPGWMDYSILQVRVSEHKDGTATLTFHQERMSDEQVREEMRHYWKAVLVDLGKILEE